MIKSDIIFENKVSYERFYHVIKLIIYLLYRKLEQLHSKYNK